MSGRVHESLVVSIVSARALSKTEVEEPPPGFWDSLVSQPVRKRSEDLQAIRTRRCHAGAGAVGLPSILPAVQATMSTAYGALVNSRHAQRHGSASDGLPESQCASVRGLDIGLWTPFLAGLTLVNGYAKLVQIICSV